MCTHTYTYAVCLLKNGRQEMSRGGNKDKKIVEISNMPATTQHHHAIDTMAWHGMAWYAIPCHTTPQYTHPCY